MFRAIVTGLAILPLCACGGGGGGVASTPAPPIATPTPTPTPTNSSITDLRASQSFANDAASSNLTINLTSKTSVSGTAAPAPLTVRYDVSTANYAVTSGGITDTFSATDKVASSNAGETRYVQRSATGTTYLTLVTKPYYGGATSNQYVALGYLQRNTTSADRQTTSFATFAYGLDSPASGIPRSGSGTFNTDVFGLETVPGAEPAVFQGRGRFDVDFLNNLFSTQTNVTRTGLISGQSIVGGGLDLTGGGRLSASSGTFAGDVVYRSSAVTLGGQLAGRFYGPNAQEIGASFSGAASDGSAFNGSLTGQRDTTLPAVNISFAQSVAPQLFYGNATTLTVRKPRNGSPAEVSDYPGNLGSGVSVASLNDKTSGNVSFGPPNSNLAGGDYTVTSIVAGDPNFTTYRRTIADQPTELELYKTASSNKEIALTYASFGRYSTTIEDDPIQSEVDRVYFTYGFRTPGGLFANRTGTASYAGVAYATGADLSGALYDVTGSSKLSLDFGSMSLSGSLALNGKGATGAIDYGSFGFAGKLFASDSTGLANIFRNAGTNVGSLLVNFYGPSADEAGGVFRLRVPDGVGANTLITGAMLAKKQ